jgi:hypothetical protein
MPDGVRFDIKMIDVKIESNIPKSKEFSLTSDMFNIKKKDLRLNKYPLITGDIELPLRVLVTMDYEDCVVFFFSYNTFSKIVKDNVRESVFNVNTPEAMKTKQKNLDNNLMLMLRLLFLTKFPTSNNVTSSYDLMSTTSLFSTNNMRRKYTYLKISGADYTVTQVILLNDILNNPFYAKFIDEISSYIKWGDNARSDIEADVKNKSEQLNTLIVKYKATSSSRDISILNNKIAANTGTYSGSNAKYDIIKDYISNLGKNETIKKLGLTYAVKYRKGTWSDHYYILEYNYALSGRSQIDLGFRNKFMMYDVNEKIDEVFFIDSVDWSNSTLEFCKNTTTHTTLAGYFNGFWKTRGNNYTIEIPSNTVTHENDKFIIQLQSKADFDKFVVTPTLNGIKMIEAEFKIIIDEQVFYDRVRISNIVLFPNNDDKTEILFSSMQTLYDLYKYAPDLSSEYKELMEECRDIGTLVKKYTFLKKILTCNDEPCINMNINSNKYNDEFFKPFNDTVKILKTMMSKNRKLVCNTDLQDKIDNYGLYKDLNGDFAKIVQRLYDIYINKTNDIELLTSFKSFNTSISEVNFGKQNLPKYEAYVHMDLLRGRADKKNIKGIKCNFKDEKTNTLVTNWLYKTESLWKIDAYPFYKLETVKSTKKKDKVVKKPLAQGGSKTRKKY